MRDKIGRTLVFLICNLRGESIRATSEVENSISNMAISPSLVSKHFAKGSVVYMRKPRDVPVAIAVRHDNDLGWKSSRTDC